MAQTMFDDDLAYALNFTEDDLRLNRLGKVSERQVMAAGRWGIGRLMLALVFSFVLLLIGIALLAHAFGDDGVLNIIGLVFVGLGFVIPLAVFALIRQYSVRAAKREAHSHTGRLTEVQRNEAARVCFVTVGQSEFTIRLQAQDILQSYIGQEFRVYYYPETRRIASMEVW